MTFPFRRHPVHALPFDAPVANELEHEYLELTPSQRAAAMRKVVQRELLVLLTGQWRRRVARVPAGLQTVLWLYTWTTVGDSLMDLAVRRHLPPALRIDLVIAPTLVPLYAEDPGFRDVLTLDQACRRSYDFVLLQDLTTSSLTLKRRCSPTAPFATVFEHLRGERFDRLGFSQRRMEQLFGIAATDPAQPSLHLPVHNRRPAAVPERRLVAVALGARDPRRRCRCWPRVLQALVERWPAPWPEPLFVLIGSANARDDLKSFAPAFLDRHCRVEIDTLDLLGAASSIEHCDAFLGADGGLMHVAVALDKPGAAIFVGIDPRLRLPTGSRMRSLFTPSNIDEIAPDDIADLLLGVWPDTGNAGNTVA